MSYHKQLFVLQGKMKKWKWLKTDFLFDWYFFWPQSLFTWVSKSRSFFECIKLNCEFLPITPSPYCTQKHLTIDLFSSIVCCPISNHDTFENYAPVIWHPSNPPHPAPKPPPQAWWGHSLSVSVKANEVPRHLGEGNSKGVITWFVMEQQTTKLKRYIVMFCVMSPFVIFNVPTRDLLVLYTKRSFKIMVGTLALQLQCL